MSSILNTVPTRGEYCTLELPPCCVGAPFWPAYSSPPISVTGAPVTGFVMLTSLLSGLIVFIAKSVVIRFCRSCSRVSFSIRRP